MALPDYGFSFVRNFHSGSSDTLTFGADTNVDVKRTLGLFDQKVRDGDRAFTRFHGDIPGDHTIHPKRIEFDVEVRGDPLLTAYWDDVYEVLETILAQPAFNTLDQLNFKFPDQAERFIRCRATTRHFERTSRTEFGLAPIEFVLKAQDPREYGPVAARNTSGVTSGTFNVTNAGNANAYPILTFTSTGANATLVNNTHSLTFASTSPPSGQFIADMDRYIRGQKGLIIYEGTTNHYDKWNQPRLLFALGRGVNNLTLTNATNVKVEWYDTWL